MKCLWRSSSTLALMWALLGFAPSVAQGVTLELSSQEDLNNLQIGQVVTFDVSLSGLAPSQELDSLAAEVIYPSSLLGSPSLSSGPIVPDGSDFFGASFPGSGTHTADGSFFALFGAPINAGGVFFQFDAEVLAAGSGSLSFGVTSASDPNVVDLITVTTGQDLSFAAVPEPSTAVLLGSAIALLLLPRGRKFLSATRRAVSECN